MSTTWIRDKVVAVAEAQAEETGEDPNEIIWQLSKELGHMAKVSEPSGGTVIANINLEKISDDADATIDRIKKSLASIDAEDIGLKYLREDQVNSIDASKIVPTFDIVSRPAHYEEGRKYEPKKVIRDWGLNYNLGAAVKYLSRAGRKNDIIEDLEKAITYIGFEIDAIKAERDEQEEA